MNNAQQKYYIQTFGCQMNVHESEKIAGILENRQYVRTLIINEADIIVFNTCCIRDTAEQKIYAKIGELKALKRINKSLIIAIVGCMTQQKNKSTELIERYNFVDIVLGTSNYLDLGMYIDKLLERRANKRGKIIDIKDIDHNIINEEFYIKRDSNVKAFVNIMYGCNNFCTYCIVPYVRGRERSRDFNKIIDEVKGLIKNGIKEITLLGQNVNSYFYKGVDFNKLLQWIDEIEGDFSVFFMTSHPKDFDSKIINTIANSKHITHNVHLPIQSGSNRILELMNRHYTVEKYIDIVKKIRQEMPDCGITTDIMVGFPGETESDFQQTIEVVKQIKFNNAFTFVYSQRNGTPASKMKQVDEVIKKTRIMKLIDVQNSISEDIASTYLNKTYKVLVDSYNENIRLLHGKLFDGKQVNINSSDKRLLGKFVSVRISNAGVSALTGDIIND